MALGIQTRLYGERMHYYATTYVEFCPMKWWTRVPIPLVNYENVIRPFTSEVWLALFLSLGAFSFYFGLTYRVYTSLDQGLTGQLVTPWDFLIFTFCRFVEPDPLPWFPKWSSGKTMVLAWSIFTMVVLFSYTGNLRANMIRKEYEKPVKVHQDVLDRGTRVHIPLNAQQTKSVSVIIGSIFLITF